MKIFSVTNRESITECERQLKSKLKRFIFNAMFEFYGMCHKVFINKAGECLGDNKIKASRYWIRKADKCIDKREDILEQYFT